MMRMYFQEKKYKKPPNPIYKVANIPLPQTSVSSNKLSMSLVLAAPSSGCGSCGLR